MSTSTYYNFTLPNTTATVKMANTTTAVPKAREKRLSHSSVPATTPVVVRTTTSQTPTNDRHSPASFVTSSSSSTSNSSLNQFNSLASSSSSSVITPNTTCTSSPSSCSSSSGASCGGNPMMQLTGGNYNNASSNVIANTTTTNTTSTTTTTATGAATNEQWRRQCDFALLRRTSAVVAPTQPTMMNTAITSTANQRQQPSPQAGTRFNVTRSPGSPQLFHSYTFHSLEPKPLKPFKSNSEYLEAMKEDLAEWLTRLYPDLDDLTADNFFAQLETGSIICRHANHVTQMGRNFMLEQQQQQHQAKQQQQSNHSAALNDCTSKDSSFSERNSTASSTSNSNNFNDSIYSSSLSSPTNDSDSDRGSSIHPLSLISNVTAITKHEQAETQNSNQNSKTFNQNNGSHYQQNKSFQAKFNDSSNSLLSISSQQRRASSPYCSAPRIGMSPTMSYQALDKHSINWFRVKTIPYKQDVAPGTFFARDNICQFILWCRSLNILECLLFETDDLVARKNEKSFILCLLEVARIGFKVGMPTPLIIQLEQEIDQEIENDAKLQRELEEAAQEKQNQDNNGNTIADCDSFQFNTLKLTTDELDTDQLDKQAVEDTEKPGAEDHQPSVTAEDDHDEAVGEAEEEVEEDIGPKPQVITNDLVSLHEKVS